MPEFFSVHKICVPLFEIDAWIVYYNLVDKGNKELQKFVKEHKFKHKYNKIRSQHGMVATEESNESFLGVLYLQHKDDLSVLEGYLVHENFHLAQEILEFKDIEHEVGKANEIYAILEQWLFKINAAFVRECHNKITII
jgi:hypothetical protein